MDMSMPSDDRYYVYDKAVIALWNKDKTNKEIAKLLRIGERDVRHAIEREKIRRETAVQVEEKLTDEQWRAPEVRQALSRNAQKSLDRIIRAHTKQLEADFEIKLRKEIKKWYEAVITPDIRQKLDRAKLVLELRKAIFTKQEYNSIIRCLHPDSALNMSPEQRTEAFRLLEKYKVILLGEKDMPTDSVDVPPPSWEEFQAQWRASRAKKR